MEPIELDMHSICNYRLLVLQKKQQLLVIKTPGVICRNSMGQSGFQRAVGLTMNEQSESAILDCPWSPNFFRFTTCLRMFHLHFKKLRHLFNDHHLTFVTSVNKKSTRSLAIVSEDTAQSINQSPT